MVEAAQEAGVEPPKRPERAMLEPEDQPALALDRAQPEAFWFLAEAAEAEGNRQTAIALLEELQGLLRPESEGLRLVADKLERLRESD